MSDDILTLWCLVNGDSIPFKASLPVNGDISDLKEIIREKGIDSSKVTVLAKDLVLWKLHKPEPLVPEIGSRIKAWGADFQTFAEKLGFAETMQQVFPDPPLGRHLHIVVKLPLTATISPSTSDKSMRSDSSAGPKTWTVSGAIRKHDIAGCYYVNPGVQRESQQCLEAVGRRQFVLLSGARASGKTTRLFWLQDQIKARGYEALYISFEGLQSWGDVSGFWRSFGSMLERKPRGQKPPSISNQTEFLDFFANDGGRIVLLLDEISELLAATPLVRSDCLRAFRLIRNDSARFNIHTIIAAGTFGILRLSSADATVISPFNISDLILNPYFSLAQTKELFQQFTQETGISIEDAVVEDVWAASGGHPGMVCLCGRAIAKHVMVLRGDPLGPVTYGNWQRFPVRALYKEIQLYPTFRSLFESLLRPAAHDAMLLLRSRFVGFLGDVDVSREEERLANYLTEEGVLLRPDPLELIYRMASPLLDGIIRTNIIPQKFPNAPSDTPPSILHTLDVLGTLTESLKYIDRELICSAVSRSFKSSRTVKVDGLSGADVPRENVYDTELLRILGCWLHRGYYWTVTGQWHLQTSRKKHKYTDIVLQKEHQVIVLELMATGDAKSVKSHIEKTPEYKKLLSATEAWVVHFTREDDYCPIWQSDEDLARGVNVVHFAHDLKFTKVVMNARWRDNGGHTHQVHEVLELI